MYEQGLQISLFFAMFEILFAKKLSKFLKKLDFFILFATISLGEIAIFDNSGAIIYSYTC